MKKIVSLLAVAGLAAAANAAVVSDWAAAPNGVSIAATNVVTGVTGVDLTRGPGIVLQGSSSTFNSNSWTVGGDLAAAVANNDYLQFGVTVDIGLALNLSDLEIRYDRSGTGPNQMAILFSSDNFATSTTVYTDASVSDTGEEAFPALGLSGITGTGLFRVYAWGASSSGGTFDIETINFAGGGTYGIRLNGEVVPTPGALALLGLGGLVAGRRRR